ncbi:hypothetical protein J2D73_12565 [Acetobacter sacchari]|uniref:Uncharacterized protein n=1 Tax=Acetobacter sacchari TaxID=2661687 RepID=A0ABS3LXI8_9PROT|nr:hypothetical protein [Acetobacter sacchari]MBO1360621.1 hypothetical protein [Acetobacter sacchari]
MTDEPTNLILEQLKLIRSDMARDKAEVKLALAELTKAVADNTAHINRLNRRTNELPLDLETMMKAEVMGRLGRYENEIDRRMDEIEAKLRDR